MRKKLSFLSLILFFALTGNAQVDTMVIHDTAVADTVVFPQTLIDTAEVDTAWKLGGNFSLQFSQAAYRNWQAGGVNAMAGNSLLSIFADRDNGGKWIWINRLNLAYGLNRQEGLFNKTDDRIELESRIDREISKNWSLSALTNFRTQFSNGYGEAGERGDSVRISTFMAPGYLVTGVGFTYKPNKRFSAFLSPLTSKMTFVQDQRLANEGAFGVDSGHTFRQEVGGYVNMNYRGPLFTNVEFQTGINLYSNYLNNNYQFIDVNGEFLLFMTINEFLTANVSLNLIYDHDIKFDVDGDGEEDGPRTQLKEVIGVGFVYNFGDRPRKR